MNQIDRLKASIAAVDQDYQDQIIAFETALNNAGEEMLRLVAEVDRLKQDNAGLRSSLCDAYGTIIVAAAWLEQSNQTKVAAGLRGWVEDEKQAQKEEG